MDESIRPQNPPPVKSSRWSPLAIVLVLAAVFFVLFLIASGAMYMHRSGNVTETQGSSGFFASNGAVGVVELNGVILDSKKTIRKLRRFEDDAAIKAVVLRLNSPGGGVAPSQEIYQVVHDYKKPLVVSMGSLAASGAFYVACGAKKVFANPGTITGSIGVIMEFADLQKLYQWAKIDRYAIKTGKFKDIGAEYRAMTPEEHALLQTMVDDVLTQFKQAVATGRHKTMAQVTAIADGRVMSGSQAKAIGLVDELGTLHDAIAEAGREGHIHGKPSVVYPERPRRGLLDLILNDARGGSSTGDDDDDESATDSLLVRLARDVLSAAGVGAAGPADSITLQQALTGSAPGIYWLWNG